MASLVRMATWLVFATLAIRAFATPDRERSQVIGALILGLSYLVITHQSNWLPIPGWLYEIFVKNRLDDLQAANFRPVGLCLFALLFALLGAVLGAHFSRSQSHAD
jgi:multisubunit Na+/H+ antiporter MnhB subunit